MDTAAERDRLRESISEVLFYIAHNTRPRVDAIRDELAAALRTASGDASVGPDVAVPVAA